MTIRLQVAEPGWSAAMGEATIAIARDKIGLFLTEEMTSEWLGFYIEKTLAAEAAIAMGSTVATAIADTLNAVLPVYDAVTSGAGASA